MDKDTILNLLQAIDSNIDQSENSRRIKYIADFIESQAVIIKEQDEVIIKYNNEYQPASEYIKQCNAVVEACKQEGKYAKLGRLALTTRAMVCGNEDFIANKCEKHCTNYQFCQKRAELQKVEGD